jgi:hypothetical protein
MIDNDTRKRLKDIVSGNVLEGAKDNCTSIRNLLCASFRTSAAVKKEFESQSIIKKEQVKLLRSFCDTNDLWVKELPTERQYLTRGGEALVYLDSNSRNVIKLNDAIYYRTWLEFFNSVVIHNLLFKNTTYTLLGFTELDETLFAVLRQSFIESHAQAELADIKQFLAFNGFENTRRNDYFNKELGLILEDMHDENILINSNTLFFIDTVFYTVSVDQIH